MQVKLKTVDSCKSFQGDNFTLGMVILEYIKSFSHNIEFTVRLNRNKIPIRFDRKLSDGDCVLISYVNLRKS